tara:strand:- start:1565 stop:1966 length:402 start_codon:yes stop_codon:yes gene_type:complete
VLNSLLRSLPYLVHTNREFGLMMAGRKPMAVFVDGKDRFPEVVARYIRLFDRHVTSGRFVRADRLGPGAGVRTYMAHRIFFTLPGEEWRVDAYLALIDGDDRWTADHERRQGELLGYEDWMNDYWIEHVYSGR